MSQYFSFYIIKKTQDNKFEYVGPYKKEGDNYETYPLLCVSRSFIDYNEFKEVGRRIQLDEMDKAIYQLAHSSGWKEEPYSTGYAISYADMLHLADKYNRGIYQGYVSKDDHKYIVTNNFRIDRWDVNLVSADEVASALLSGDDQYRSYVPVMFYDYNNSGAYADYLTQSIADLQWMDSDTDYYFLFETEY